MKILEAGNRRGPTTWRPQHLSQQKKKKKKGGKKGKGRGKKRENACGSPGLLGPLPVTRAARSSSRQDTKKGEKTGKERGEGGGGKGLVKAPAAQNDAVLIIINSRFFSPEAVTRRRGRRKKRWKTERASPRFP